MAKSPGTSIKDAIARWEEKNGQKVSESKAVKLYCQLPLIDKMDSALGQLKECEYISLSTNAIEKIANLNALKNLKILSLGRNYIKSFVGLEAVGDTLEQLWISYNLIDKMKGVNVLKKLKVLYMMHNKVKDIKELDKLKDMDALENLNFIGNPCREEINNEDVWRQKVTTTLPKLKRLDNKSTAGGSNEAKEEGE